ncbi:MAG: hypothetical protein LAO05_01225 [Acidobacteriia bacterium]|nr:hypothetical protein [Terriglobia bacterium]
MMRHAVRQVVPLAATMVFATAVLAASPASSPCVAIQISSAEETPRGGWGSTFSAAKTTDLTFMALFLSSASGEHLLEFRVFTPRGFLYRSMKVPAVLAQVGSGTQQRKLAGYPHPVTVKAGSKVVLQGTTYWRVDVPFPVGGTDIAATSLYGTWKVQAYLNGSDQPCGPAASFGIKP